MIKVVVFFLIIKCTSPTLNFEFHMEFKLQGLVKYNVHLLVILVGSIQYNILTKCLML